MVKGDLKRCMTNITALEIDVKIGKQKNNQILYPKHKGQLKPFVNVVCSIEETFGLTFGKDGTKMEVLFTYYKELITRQILKQLNILWNLYTDK